MSTQDAYEEYYVPHNSKLPIFASFWNSEDKGYHLLILGVVNKKLVNETGLLREGIRIGMLYAEKRGVVEFEATDSHHEKVEYLYRLLVHDRLIQPLAKMDLSQKAMAHKLALWVAKQLPKDHPLLQG